MSGKADPLQNIEAEMEAFLVSRKELKLPGDYRDHRLSRFFHKDIPKPRPVWKS